jgi:hypothetical protein
MGGVGIGAVPYCEAEMGTHRTRCLVIKTLKKKDVDYGSEKGNFGPERLWERALFFFAVLDPPRALFLKLLSRIIGTMQSAFPYGL